MRNASVRTSVALIAVAGGAGLVWAIAGAALSTVEGQRADAAAMEAVYARSDVITRILGYLGYVSIGTALAALIALTALAVLRGDRRAAVGTVVLVLGANLTTQLLKRIVLDRPNLTDELPNSLPSGHTTLITSFVLAALVVTPWRLRYPAVLIGALLATATGASTVVAGWHRPSDVFAALAVCLAWGGAVTLLVRWSQDYAPLATAAFALAGAALAGVLLISIGVRPTGGWPGFADAALVLLALGGGTAFTVACFTRVVSPR